MRRLALPLIFAGLLAASLFGCASSDFTTLVAAIEAEPGVHRQYIPMLGVARTGVRVLHPGGVRDFRLAVFNHAGPRGNPELNRAVDAITERGWMPMVKVRQADGEQATIWLREAGSDQVEMLIVAREARESVVVQLEIDAATFAQLTSDPASVIEGTLGSIGN